MTKKVKVIIAVIVSAVIVAGVATGLYFGLKEKPQGTSFAETGLVEVIDENTIEFSYICPYFELAKFEVTNENGIYVTTDDKTIAGEITLLEYDENQGEALESGMLTVTADLEETLVTGKSYHAVIKANSIELEKENYINPDITADFKLTSNDDGKLEAEEEKFKDVKSVALSNVKAELFEKDGKAYFSITAKAAGLTKYNETEIKNLQTMAFYRYKTESGTFVRPILDNIQFSAENGIIEISCETEKENLIPGQDYTVKITKGFFTNDDKTVVNEEYESTFTYIEQ